MAQARRRQPKKARQPRRRSTSGLGMLFAGIIIGCVLTTLFLGWKKDPDHGLGSGINQMLAKSRQSNSSSESGNQTQEQARQQQSPSYDFYTILPEIEQVIPEEYVPPKPKQAQQTTSNTNQNQTQTKSQNHYLLQAGSFAKQEQANQLKAKLALSGYESYIQKVTVDGKKYYRVRMGPFRKLDKLDKASKDLAGKGINAMRIKVSKG